MALTSPPYSFVQFNFLGMDDCCKGEQSMALPVLAGTDLKFQVINTAGNPGALEVINFLGVSVSSQSGFTATPDATVWSWSNDIDISAIGCDECFYLRLGGVSLSNVFKKVCDGCYTSILEYTNGEDYGSFLYCNAAFTNRIRLPFYLSKPKMNEERTVYRRSQGSIRLVKSMLQKEYTATTDHLPEQMHDSFAVALAHDTVSMFTSAYNGYVSKSGDYTPAWEDEQCMAPAEFRVLATPLLLRNNNCDDCADPVDPGGCVPPSVATFSFPAAVGGIYPYVIDILGDGPFTISGIVAPVWMSYIEIIGNTLSLFGDPSPSSVEEDMPFQVTITGACGSTTIDQIIPGTPEVCAPVAFISGAPTIPDGVVGTAYSYSFSVAGDGPFAFNLFDIPSWMTIAASGNTITLSGTPDVEAIGLAVEFNITNCSGANAVSIVQTIDIGPDEVGVIEGNNNLSYTNGGGWTPSDGSAEGTITGDPGGYATIHLWLNSSYLSAQATLYLDPLDGSAPIVVGVLLSGTSSGDDSVIVVFPTGGVFAFTITGSTSIGGTTYYSAHITVT